VNEKKKDFQIVQLTTRNVKRITPGVFGVFGCPKFPSPSTTLVEKQDDGKIPSPSSLYSRVMNMLQSNAEHIPCGQFSSLSDS
jgi:hypothetical protein